VCLELVGGFPEHIRTAEDTSVNMELYSLGLPAFFEQRALLIHSSLSRHLRTLVLHHFQRGFNAGILLFARDLSTGGMFLKRLTVKSKTIFYVMTTYWINRIIWITINIHDNDSSSLVWRFYSALPLIVIGVLSMMFGTLCGYVTSHFRRSMFHDSKRLSPSALL
jgi:hypothetical protein